MEAWYSMVANCVSPNYPKWRQLSFGWRSARCILFGLLWAQRELQRTPNLREIYIQQLAWKQTKLSQCDFFFETSVEFLKKLTRPTSGDRRNILFVVECRVGRATVGCVETRKIDGRTPRELEIQRVKSLLVVGCEKCLLVGRVACFLSRCVCEPSGCAGSRPNVCKNRHVCLLI